MGDVRGNELIGDVDVECLINEYLVDFMRKVVHDNDLLKDPVNDTCSFCRENNLDYLACSNGGECWLEACQVIFGYFKQIVALDFDGSSDESSDEPFNGD